MNKTTMYTNPVNHKIVEDWPSGRKRVTATFSVETKVNKGQRVSRVTTGKPKTTTYAERCAIVDGDDDKTYILCSNASYGMISVYMGTMGTSHETIHETSQPKRYAILKRMIESLDVVRS